MTKDRPSGYNRKEISQRMEAIFRGAFAGPPTPLKDIPKRSGESRQQPKKTRRASVASAKSAPRGP